MLLSAKMGVQVNSGGNGNASRPEVAAMRDQIMLSVASSPPLLVTPSPFRHHPSVRYQLRPILSTGTEPLLPMIFSSGTVSS